MQAIYFANPTKLKPFLNIAQAAHAGKQTHGVVSHRFKKVEMLVKIEGLFIQHVEHQAEGRQTLVSELHGMA